MRYAGLKVLTPPGSMKDYMNSDKIKRGMMRSFNGPGHRYVIGYPKPGLDFLASDTVLLRFPVHHRLFLLCRRRLFRSLIRVLFSSFQAKTSLEQSRLV